MKMRVHIVLMLLLLLVQPISAIVLVEGPNWGTRAEYGKDIEGKKWKVDLEEGRADFLIRQKNGLHSSLDYAVIHVDKSTIWPMKAVQDGKDVIPKVGGLDNNVLDIHYNPVEVSFYLPKGKEYYLEVYANEYEEVELPLRSPKRSFAEAQVFEGTMDVDGILDEDLGPINNPVWWILANGRPQGYAYSWFRTDGAHLYAAIETPDNTNIGNEQISLIVEVPKFGFEKYTITKHNNIHGKSGFQYTDNIFWEHKIYEFKIPIRRKIDAVRYAIEYY